MHPIIGGAQVPFGTIYSFLTRRYTYISEQEKTEIASAYTTYGKLTGIGNVYPLGQNCHETGYGTSERWRKSYNPAGIGSTSDKVWGGHFETIAHGVLAQYAHLLAYATTDSQLSPPLKQIVLCDPRLDAMTKAHGRGCAPNWEDLRNRWAVPGRLYPEKIINIGELILKG